MFSFLFKKWNRLISVFHMKITVSVPKSSHQDHGLCYLHHSPLLLKKVFVIAVFLSKLEHKSMVYWIYNEILLVWGLVSTWLANATLPVKLKSAKLWSLLFYSELNELCGNYVWILKWVNLHCNWINLISVLNFPKQWNFPNFPITDAYSGPCPSSKMECITKKVNSF